MKCNIGKLEFKGIITMNEGEIQIFVNDQFLTYIDLDNFDYDYEQDLNKYFETICEIIYRDNFDFFFKDLERNA